MKTEEVIKGYKGFDKDLKCRGFQYKEGETYEMDKKPIRCTENGFHFCKEPLDVFAYYYPSDSVFHHVEGSGEIDESAYDSKIAVQKMKIGTEISLADFIKLSFEAIFKKCKKENNLEHSTGDNSASSATGDSSASSATGNNSASSATGDSSASSATGYSSASSATRYRSASSATGDGSASSATGDSSASSATGDSSASSATGDGSVSSATGNRSASSATGDSSASLTTGCYSNSQITNNKEIISKNAVAIGTGYQNKAKAPLDCWIVLAEWNEQYSQIINLKTAKVDGKQILPNTWYMLKNGEFIKSE